VLRIENGPLWHRYCEKKITLIATRLDLKGPHRLKAKSTEISKLFPNVELNDKINELFLFHGTKLENAMSIVKNGFDPSMSSGLYGAGTYCADYSCKSMQYAPEGLNEERCFLVCRVLMGLAYRTKTLLSDIKEPTFDGVRYDSVFAGEGKANNGRQAHNEFVTYEKDQVYPEYLVYLRV
jgi:hypothetical protein